MSIETERLILRQWQESDLPAFAEMNADPIVMRYFPRLLTRGESDDFARRMHRLIKDNGFGFWAVSAKDTGGFLGMVGLHQQPAESGIPCAPLLEVGWRLRRPAWGKGYATEAAKAALQFAFEVCAVKQVYAFTAVGNRPSRAVVERLGMTDINRDFDHPKIEPSHPLRRHCLYRIRRFTWLDKRGVI